jgi:hypothetical protein
MTIRAFAATYRKSLVVIGVLLLAAVHFTGLRIESEKEELVLLQSAWATYRIETVVRLEQVRELKLYAGLAVTPDGEQSDNPSRGDHRRARCFRCKRLGKAVLAKIYVVLKGSIASKSSTVLAFGNSANSRRRYA